MNAIPGSYPCDVPTDVPAEPSRGYVDPSDRALDREENVAFANAAPCICSLNHRRSTMGGCVVCIEVKDRHDWNAFVVVLARLHDAVTNRCIVGGNVTKPFHGPF